MDGLITIDGNDMNVAPSLIRVNEGSTLVMHDFVALTGAASNNQIVTILGTFIMYGGSITNAPMGNNVILAMFGSGRFYMHGGSITGNSTTGVELAGDDSFFRITYGEISGNARNLIGTGTAQHGNDALGWTDFLPPVYDNIVVTDGVLQ